MHHERRMNRGPPGAGGRWARCRPTRPARRLREVGDLAPVVLDLPFRGSWLAINSPARRVPSHGTTLFGTTYAIDFVAVDAGGRSAPRTWRTFLYVEPPEHFRGFGAPILAPASGTVVIAHDGEPDHAARRSPVALVSYALGQAGRARKGMAAIAGNHVVVALGPAGPYVAVVHLRHATVSVRPGDPVRTGSRSGSAGTRATAPSPTCTCRSPTPPTGGWRPACRCCFGARDRATRPGCRRSRRSCVHDRTVTRAHPTLGPDAP